MLHHNTPSDKRQNGDDDYQRGNGQRGLQAALGHTASVMMFSDETGMP
jgi:hypothetical protein